MKKSLFSLALIASSLLAVQAATVQIDFGRSDATTEGALNMNYDNASASLGSMPFSLGDTFRDGLLTQTADGSGYFTVTFSGLAAGEYALSIFGGFTGKDVFAGQTWTIGNADASNAVWTSFGTDASGNWAEISSVTGDNSGVLTPGNAGTSSATANKGLYSSVENIVVGEDGTLTLTIQGNGSSSYGRTALNYLALTQVPEPATAALSLLGAAALFLRRRRA